jgi:uncharacterized coiled-coil protein SlyX
MGGLPTEFGERVTQLELLVMHLQHDLEQLSSVVVEQEAELTKLRGALGKVEHRVLELAERQDPSSPADDKPPHY